MHKIIGLPVTVSMMMVDMDKICHCGAKIGAIFIASKKLYYNFANL